MFGGKRGYLCNKPQHIRKAFKSSAGHTIALRCQNAMLRPLIAVAACAQVLLPSILSAAVHVLRAHHYHERASLPRPGRLWGKPRAGGAGLPQQAGEDTVAWGAGWRAMRPDCHIGVWTAALGGSGRHAGACAVVVLAISQLCAMPYWGSQRSARRGRKRCVAARNWRQCGRIFI